MSETKSRPDVMDRILEQCIKPNAHALAAIIARGEVAVAVFELDEQDPLVQRAVRDLGWDGAAAVFQLPAQHKKRLIRSSEEHADHVTARWLRGGRTGRIFLWTGRGTLLINFRPGEGYSLEPGSTDASRAQA